MTVSEAATKNTKGYVKNKDATVAPFFTILASSPKFAFFAELMKSSSKSSVAARVDAFNKSNSIKDLCPDSLPEKHKKDHTDSSKENRRQIGQDDRLRRPRHKRGSSVRELSAKLEDKTRPSVNRNKSVRALSKKLDGHARSSCPISCGRAGKETGRSTHTSQPSRNNY